MRNNHTSTPECWEEWGGASYVSIREAAERLSCSDTHIRRLIKSGRLVAIDISATPHRSTPRVSVASLVTFVAATRLEKNHAA